jgi:hypothetical protein
MPWNKSAKTAVKRELECIWASAGGSPAIRIEYKYQPPNTPNQHIIIDWSACDGWMRV